jgi:hypothetical protein
LAAGVIRRTNGLSCVLFLSLSVKFPRDFASLCRRCVCVLQRRSLCRALLYGISFALVAPFVDASSVERRGCQDVVVIAFPRCLSLLWLLSVRGLGIPTVNEAETASIVGDFVMSASYNAVLISSATSLLRSSAWCRRVAYDVNLEL